MAATPALIIIFLKFKRIQSLFKVRHLHRNNKKIKKNNFQDNLKSPIKIQVSFLTNLLLSLVKSKVHKPHLNLTQNALMNLQMRLINN